MIGIFLMFVSLPIAQTPAADASAAITVSAGPGVRSGMQPDSDSDRGGYPADRTSRGLRRAPALQRTDRSRTASPVDFIPMPTVPDVPAGASRREEPARAVAMVTGADETDDRSLPGGPDLDREGFLLKRALEKAQLSPSVEAKWSNPNAPSRSPKRGTPSRSHDASSDGATSLRNAGSSGATSLAAWSRGRVRDVTGGIQVSVWDPYQMCV